MESCRNSPIPPKMEHLYTVMPPTRTPLALLTTTTQCCFPSGSRPAQQLRRNDFTPPCVFQHIPFTKEVLAASLNVGEMEYRTFVSTCIFNVILHQVHRQFCIERLRSVIRFRPWIFFLCQMFNYGLLFGRKYFY